jgi:hypothetical protein
VFAASLCRSVLLVLALLPSQRIAESEPSFDHEQFCLAAKDIERLQNEDRGTWLDDHTRHDGMTVDCEERVVELKLFVQGAFGELVGNWQDRTTYKWSEDYCTDPGWAAAINHQWRVALTVQSGAGELFSVRADCH